MLCLSRKRKEKIHIGDDITIVIFEARGGKVRLGIQAPPEVPVHRGEVYEAIEREKAKQEQTRKREEGWG